MRYLFFVLILFLTASLSAQSVQQKRLEKKKAQLEKEVNQISQLLSEIKNNEASIVALIEDLNNKARVHQQIIDIINQQTIIIGREIAENKMTISENEKELKKLKKDYAEMIFNSYKEHITQNRIMFILSSENFFHAYKRLSYIKQYTNYRKKQGLAIKKKSEQIAEFNTSLEKQLANEQKLKDDNEKIKIQLTKDRTQKQELVEQIRKKESNYRQQVLQKQKESQLLDREIERLIRESIEASRAKSNKESRSTKSKELKLTPESKIIAKSFVRNKGKLPWPVKRGVILHGYGEYSDPIYPNVKYNNNGITINSPRGESARSVFKGVVSGIIKVPGGSKAVQVRHGNYITTYYNLSDVFVRKGEKIVRKQTLGKIYTNPITGKTELKFFLYKDVNKLNPERWISKN